MYRKKGMGWQGRFAGVLHDKLLNPKAVSLMCTTTSAMLQIPPCLNKCFTITMLYNITRHGHNFYLMPFTRNHFIFCIKGHHVRPK